MDIPASRFIPSRPASTHDTLQTPQTSLSFPSFTHPHLAAASASIVEGLLAYVLSLYVARRPSRLCMDDGRYSNDAVEPELRGIDTTRNLVGRALRVLAAVRARMAARRGVLERSAAFPPLEVILMYRRKSLGLGRVQGNQRTNDAGGPVLMPYLESVEYRVWTKWWRLAGRCSEGSCGPIASSRLCMASSSLR